MAWLPKGWRRVVQLEDRNGKIVVYAIDSYTLVDAAIQTTLPRTKIPEYHYERSIYFAPSDILTETIEKLFYRSKYKLVKFIERLEWYARFVIGEATATDRRCLLVPESATSWYRLLRVSELRGFLCYRPEAIEHIKWLYNHGLLPYHWEEYVPLILKRARKILDP